MPHALEYNHATGTLSWFWLLVAIPLVSGLLLLVLGRSADKWGHLLGCLSGGVAFVIGLVHFFSLRGLSGNRTAAINLFDFIHVGRFTVDFGLLYDPLSAVFVLL